MKKKLQRKLKKTYRTLSQSAKQGNAPAWIAALSAIAGGVTTALMDSDKRRQLGEIASDAKHKATEVVLPSYSHDGGHKHHANVDAH